MAVRCDIAKFTVVDNRPAGDPERGGSPLAGRRLTGGRKYVYGRLVRDFVPSMGSGQSGNIRDKHIALKAKQRTPLVPRSRIQVDLVRYVLASTCRADECRVTPFATSNLLLGIKHHQTLSLRQATFKRCQAVPLLFLEFQSGV